MFKQASICQWMLFLVIPLMLSSSGCAKRPFIWVEDLPQEVSEPAGYRIAPGNRLLVSVWGQNEISGEHLVREDGHISVVLVGDVLVQGLTTREASAEIAKKLEGGIVQNVHVDVSAITAVPQFITIVGEVESPGKMELSPHDNLVDIISRSEGFTDFAHTDEIYVLRNTEELQVIRFDFDRITSCPHGGINFKLLDGDIVIVE